jgi:hypothetical protein
VAGDLIPPPSPARRSPPDPGADPEANAQLEAAAALAADAAAPPPGPSPFRGRFGFLFGALAGIAACAIGVLAVLLATPPDDGPKLADNWSRWQPSTADMVDGAQSIAAHVGLKYKLDGGDQLVSVRSSALELQGAPIGVAVRPKGGELEILEGEGLLYLLNGLGPNGTLAGGPATEARGRLLMREALELALYSFRYLEDVTMVAVLLPQGSQQESAGSTSQQQTRAVFYRPGDLLGELQVPLARTLSPQTPRPKTMTKAESARIDALTLRNVFLASVQALEADRNYLVLAEPDTVR